MKKITLLTLIIIAFLSCKEQNSTVDLPKTASEVTESNTIKNDTTLFLNFKTSMSDAEFKNQKEIENQNGSLENGKFITEYFEFEVKKHDHSIGLNGIAINEKSIDFDDFFFENIEKFDNSIELKFNNLLLNYIEKYGQPIAALKGLKKEQIDTQGRPLYYLADLLTFTQKAEAEATDKNRNQCGFKCYFFKTNFKTILLAKQVRHITIGKIIEEKLKGISQIESELESMKHSSSTAFYEEYQEGADIFESVINQYNQRKKSEDKKIFFTNSDLMFDPCYKIKNNEISLACNQLAMLKFLKKQRIKTSIIEFTGNGMLGTGIVDDMNFDSFPLKQSYVIDIEYFKNEDFNKKINDAKQESIENSNKEKVNQKANQKKTDIRKL